MSAFWGKAAVDFVTNTTAVDLVHRFGTILCFRPTQDGRENFGPP
jgi:hypothetical protein